MKTLLLMFMTCLCASAATQQGVSFDPSTSNVFQSGLNQTFSTATIRTQLVSLYLTADRVAGISGVKGLTNTAVTIAQLEALIAGGSKGIGYALAEAWA